MFKIIFLLYFFSPTCLRAQALTLRVLHDAEPVPYVSVIDSAFGILGYTNGEGELIIKRDNYSIKFSHVSYRNAILRIKRSQSDSIETIQLTPKSEVLDTVEIITSIINTKKFYTEGAYDRKSSNGLITRLHLFIGTVFDSIPDGPQYLRSIKFRLHKNNFKNYPFVLELKLYGINSERMLSPEPLNTKPIYIRSEDLGRKNEVLVNERIRIPDNGIFVSIEMPEKFEEAYDDTIHFMTTTGSTTPRTYSFYGNTGVWPPETLYHKAMPWSLGDKHFLELCLSITFWKTK